MKRTLLFLLAAGLIVLAHPSLGQLIELKAEKFIEYITVADPYREWQVWPGKDKLYKGKSLSGHGVLITTYANLTAQGSIRELKYPAASRGPMKGMADGSIIVAENYDADKTLQGLTTMYKVKGFNPDAGDWYWVEATPKGEVLSSGKTQACIDCHRAQAENDYIWTGEVVKGKYMIMGAGQENKVKSIIEQK